MNSALNSRLGPRNSALRSVAIDRSSITSTGCLPSSSPIWPSDLPTYFSSSGLFSTHCTIRCLGTAADSAWAILVERVIERSLLTASRISGSCILASFSSLVPVVMSRQRAATS